jgi:hypothetical protein
MRLAVVPDSHFLFYIFPNSGTTWRWPVALLSPLNDLFPELHSSPRGRRVIPMFSSFDHLLVLSYRASR